MISGGGLLNTSWVVLTQLLLLLVAKFNLRTYWEISFVFDFEVMCLFFFLFYFLVYSFIVVLTLRATGKVVQVYIDNRQWSIKSPNNLLRVIKFILYLVNGAGWISTLLCLSI